MTSLRGMAASVDGPRPEVEVRARRLDVGLTQLLGPGQLVAYYQPVVDIGSRRLGGVEALARWVSQGGQVLEPADIFAVIEQAAIAVDIDAQMLALAAHQVAIWRQTPGHEALELHVNVCPDSLRDPALATRVARTCGRAGLPLTALWLEVTESSMIEDLSGAAKSLAALRDLGARIAVDDFGTGYATLAYVKELPIDGIKIDRSFVTDIVADDVAQAIVGAVVRMARHLTLTVVVEGVEDLEQEACVVELGVRLGQGYLYGPPQAAASAIAMFDAAFEPHAPPFVPSPVLDSEEERLRVLHACDSLRGQPEPVLDVVTATVSETCGAPYALVILVDRHWSWFVSTSGTRRRGIPRDHSHAAHVLTEPDRLLVVPDAAKDGRFAWHPDVQEKHGIKSFAGVTLMVAGQPVGALWVSDTCPRHLSDRQLELLRLAGADVEAHFELRYRNAELRHVKAQLAEAEGRLGESPSSAAPFARAR